jgi:predicted  nucleic acid-binding Zn-ribbon protein
MNRRILLLTVAGLAASLGAYGNPARADVTAKEVGRQAAQTAESGATYAEQEKDKYVHKARAELDELRSDIDRLGVKARTARDEAKAKLDKDIAALNRKREAAERKLADLQSANAGAWKHLKAGMDNALDDLKRSFAKARKEFD